MTLVATGNRYMGSNAGAGPVLEQQGNKLAVVTAIAAPAAMRVTFEGDGGHAGGQLMHLR